jgi:amino acid permease
MDAEAHRANFNFAKQQLMMNQVRRFTWTDYLLVFGVFIVGFVFSMILNNYRNSTNEKIAEISKKFHGLKGEYEYVQ